MNLLGGLSSHFNTKEWTLNIVPSEQPEPAENPEDFEKEENHVEEKLLGVYLSNKKEHKRKLANKTLWLENNLEDDIYSSWSYVWWFGLVRGKLRFYWFDTFDTLIDVKIASSWTKKF